MATKLEKDVTRETTVTVDDKELQITITSDQKILLKKKGLRKGGSEITIEELWIKLNESAPKPKKSKSDIGAPMVSLYDLRHHSAISNLGPELTAKFDGILCSLIRDFYPDLM